MTTEETNTKTPLTDEDRAMLLSAWREFMKAAMPHFAAHCADTNGPYAYHNMANCAALYADAATREYRKRAKF